MRRFFAVLLASMLVGALASPASAAKVSVNVALNIVAWGHNGSYCDVAVDDYLDNEVESYCFGSGGTWFTVRVEGVGSGPLQVKAFSSGDCSGKAVTVKRKTAGVAVVKVRNRGEFDCTYKSVTVRWP